MLIERPIPHQNGLPQSELNYLQQLQADIYSGGPEEEADRTELFHSIVKEYRIKYPDDQSQAQLSILDRHPSNEYYCLYTVYIQTPTLNSTTSLSCIT